MVEVPTGTWMRYFTDEHESELISEQVGKWMYVTRDMDEAVRLCREAVATGVVVEAKHSLLMQLLLTGNRTYLCCFYLNGHHIEEHRRVLRFFLDHDLIRRDENGYLENIPFKYDYQTIAGEYGENFRPKLVLSDFVDLKTGDMLDVEPVFD